MLTKTTIALIAAVLIGVASTAQAGPDRGRDERGGYHVGPLGQWFGGPPVRRYGYVYSAPYAYSEPYGAYGAYDYAPADGYYVYRPDYPPGWHYTPDYGWHYGPPY
jgi:hypothetical protein